MRKAVCKGGYFYETTFPVKEGVASDSNEQSASARHGDIEVIDQVASVSIIGACGASQVDDGYASFQTRGVLD